MKKLKDVSILCKVWDCWTISGCSFFRMDVFLQEQHCVFYSLTATPDLPNPFNYSTMQVGLKPGLPGTTPHTQLLDEHTLTKWERATDVLWMFNYHKFGNVEIYIDVLLCVAPICSYISRAESRECTTICMNESCVNHSQWRGREIKNKVRTGHPGSVWAI